MRALVAACALLAGSGCAAVDPVLGGILEYQLWRAGSGHHVHVQRNGHDLDLYVEEHGPPSDCCADAPTPVLLLHGGFGAADVMAFQTRELAKTRRVIAVDTRGHGRSGDDGQPFHYSDFADDFLALLDALGERQVDVVGWSDGGNAALIMAERAPSRIRRVVAIGANASPAGMTDAMRTMLGADKVDEHEVDQIRLFYSAFSRDPGRFDSVLDRLRTLWLSEPTLTDADLAAIRAPTLVLVGEKDAVKLEHSQYIARTVAHGRLEVLKGATHSAPLDAPAAVNEAVLRFLDAPMPLRF